MSEIDLDNAIAQAEQFLVFAKELKSALDKQKAEIAKAEADAIARNLSDEYAEKQIWNAKYSNSVDGTRTMGVVKHACVTLSFSLAKLRK